MIFLFKQFKLTSVKMSRTYNMKVETQTLLIYTIYQNRKIEKQ